MHCTQRDRPSLKLNHLKKIRRALRKRVQLTPDASTAGDKVYYKRPDNKEWRGPGVVIGHDGSVVFVRHGGLLVRVHKCRLRLVHPTNGKRNCAHESPRLIMAVSAQCQWKLYSMDIKTAFLQGQTMDREVYITPPKEAKCNKIWRLNKSVYGLRDASLHWYNKVKSIMIENDGVLSTV